MSMTHEQEITDLQNMFYCR